MKSLHRDIFACIQAALTGEAAALSRELPIAEMYEIAKAHQIVPLVYHGLYLSEADLSAATEMQTKTLQLTVGDQLQCGALSAILEAFSQNGIDHMPLKGSSIKNLYPSSEMRLMSDFDILIREEQYEKIKPIMLSLGFTEGVESDHELFWHKKPKICVELHKRLIPSYNDDYYEYYKDPWAKAVPGTAPHRYCMRHEDEYLYIFTHLTKHYRDGGIGIKHLVDLWRYADRYADMDFEYIGEELDKLCLRAFHENITSTIAVWFAHAAPTEITELITERIVESGAYGLTERKKIATAAKASAREESVGLAKRKKLLHYLFLPMADMKKRYPVLEKAPILLPLLWVVRWVTAVFGRRDRIRTVAAEIGRLNETTVDGYNRELSAVGLSYDLKRDKNANDEKQREGRETP